jgi:anthranilate synthase component 2
MKILIIDNYDSFTYNLMQYVQMSGAKTVVELNDKINLEEIFKLNIDGIILSPGPGTPLNPKDVGVCTDIIKNLAGRIPILGVCLGHQLIGHLYGGKIAKIEPRHGQKSLIKKKINSKILQNINGNFEAMRYHSLVIEKENFPSELNITATTKDGIIMAIEHFNYQVYGVQFHPESIGTFEGKKIIENFLEVC